MINSSNPNVSLRVEHHDTLRLVQDRGGYSYRVAGVSLSRQGPNTTQLICWLPLHQFLKYRFIEHNKFNIDIHQRACYNH